MSLIAAGPALAQVDLGGALSGDQSTAVVGAVVGTVSSTAAPVLGPQNASGTDDVVSATAESVAATTSPVASAVTPAAEQAGPVVQAAAPVVHSTVQPVLETAAPVVHSTVQPVLEAAAPALDAVEPTVTAVTQPVLQAATPVLGSATSVLGTTAPLLEETALVGATTTGGVGPLGGDTAAGPILPRTEESHAASSVSAPPLLSSTLTPAPGGRAYASEAPRAARPEPRLRPARHGRGPGRWTRQAGAVMTTLSIDAGWLDPTARRDRGGGRASTATPQRRTPGAPGNPLGLLNSVAPGAASGSSLLVFAAFVAALLLVAPGLGRRLRPLLAPWPRPVALPSLERPG